MESDSAREVNSYSLGTDYNRPGHETFTLFGILKNSVKLLFN